MGICCGFAGAAQKDEVQSVANQLSESIDVQPKPRLIPVGNVIVIEGEFEKFSDLVKISGLTESLGELTVPSGNIMVRNLTRLSDKGKSELAEKITTRIGAREITAAFENDSLLLEGSADSDFQADRAVEIAKTFSRSLARRPAAENAEPTYNKHSAKGNFEIIDLLRVKPSRKAVPRAAESNLPIIEIPNPVEDTGRGFKELAPRLIYA